MCGESLDDGGRKWTVYVYDAGDAWRHPVWGPATIHAACKGDNQIGAAAGVDLESDEFMWHAEPL